MNPKENKKAGCGGIGCALLIAAVMIPVMRSCSGPSTQELDKRASDLLAVDKQEAAVKGLSLDDYRKAKWASDKAYAACNVEAERRAKYGAKADWEPNSDWIVHGKEITIIGRDMQMQNGFSAYSHVTYTCVWNMETERIISLSITGG